MGTWRPPLQRYVTTPTGIRLGHGHSAAPVVYCRDFAYADNGPIAILPGRMARVDVKGAPARTFAELLSGPTIDIYVGPERKRWTLHRNLLRHSSSYFEPDRARYSDSEKVGTLGEEDRLDLPDDDPRGFEMLVQWLYQGELEDADHLNDEVKYEYAVACHKLYLLCDKFDMPELKNVAMDRYRLCLNEAHLVPDADEINEIYRASPAGSAFQDLMVKIAARQIMDPEVDRDAEAYRTCLENNPSFAIELINAIKNMSGGILFEDPTLGHVCSYHDHRDTTRCQATPAVVVKIERRNSSGSVKLLANEHPKEIVPAAQGVPVYKKKAPRKLNAPARSSPPVGNSPVAILQKPVEHESPAVKLSVELSKSAKAAPPANKSLVAPALDHEPSSQSVSPISMPHTATQPPTPVVRLPQVTIGPGTKPPSPRSQFASTTPTKAVPPSSPNSIARTQAPTIRTSLVPANPSRKPKDSNTLPSPPAIASASAGNAPLTSTPSQPPTSPQRSREVSSILPKPLSSPERTRLPPIPRLPTASPLTSPPPISTPSTPTSSRRRRRRDRGADGDGGTTPATKPATSSPGGTVAASSIVAVAPTSSTPKSTPTKAKSTSDRQPQIDKADHQINNIENIPPPTGTRESPGGMGKNTKRHSKNNYRPRPNGKVVPGMVRHFNSQGGGGDDGHRQPPRKRGQGE